MTITAPDARISEYEPVTPQTDFAAAFPVFDNDDLKVFVDGVERDDFAVTATYDQGISNNAKAVFAVGVTGLVQVVGSRDPHRTNRFGNGGGIPARDLNLAFDTLEGEMQEARRDIGRSLKVDFGGAPPSISDLQADMDEAIAASAAAIGAANGQYRFETVAAFVAANIPSVIRFTETAGYLFRGDRGGALFVKLDSAPGVVKPWHKQSADGGWWELARGQDIYVEMFGVTPGDPSIAGENATAIQNALDFLDAAPSGAAGKLHFGPGNFFYTPDPSIYQIRPHVICGVGVGAMPNVDLYEIQDGGTLAVTGTALVLYGDGSSKKLVRTRRNYRASSGDAQDPAISVGWDCQALGARFENIRFEVYCDYTDLTQANLGANWDVNLLVSRVNAQLFNVHMRGYPRFCHVLLDATRGVGLPEFNPIFPTDIHPKGIDGISIVGFRSNGTTGIRLLGPKPKTGLLHPGFSYDRACKIAASGNPTDGDTVTIDAEVFTFRTVKNYRREVLIGASAAATLANLKTEWLIGKQAPFEVLTLNVSGNNLEIYSTSTTPIAVSEMSGNLAVQLLGSATAATQTETISDPAQYYDQILGALVDDGRNSLGASDFFLDDFIISVAHHSGYRMSDKGSDRHTEPDTAHACLHIDGFGGSIFIYKWFIGGGRFESVEPFTVRLGLTGRGHILGCGFDSNVAAWLSTTGGALTSADQWGKVSAEDYNTCRVSMFTHDDPSSGFAYFPHRANGNRLDTNFIKTVNSFISETTGIIGTTLTVGDQNNGADIGYTEIIGGETGQADLRFSAKGNSTFARVRGTPSNGVITTYTKTGGAGALTARTQQVDDRFHVIGRISITDGVAVPATVAGVAQLYVDSADGDLKIKFGDGTVKTIVVDT